MSFCDEPVVFEQRLQFADCWDFFEKFLILKIVVFGFFQGFEEFFVILVQPDQEVPERLNIGLKLVDNQLAVLSKSDVEPFILNWLYNLLQAQVLELRCFLVQNLKPLFKAILLDFDNLQHFFLQHSQTFPNFLIFIFQASDFVLGRSADQLQELCIWVFAELDRASVKPSLELD